MKSVFKYSMYIPVHMYASLGKCLCLHLEKLKRFSMKFYSFIGILCVCCHLICKNASALICHELVSFQYIVHVHKKLYFNMLASSTSADSIRGMFFLSYLKEKKREIMKQDNDIIYRTQAQTQLKVVLHELSDLNTDFGFVGNVIPM